MKKTITLKSKFKIGDIVEFCNVKIMVVGHRFTTETYYSKDKDGKQKTEFVTYVSLKCKVLEEEAIPKHWNQDGTIYPLERDGDIKLIKRA